MNIIKGIKKLSNKKKKRVGRGISAGQGRTAGRGTKGQKSRAGHNIPKRFEGGQTNLSLRLPKRSGFSHIKKDIKVIGLKQISDVYKNGETVNYNSLIIKKLIKKGELVKILNNGKLSVKVKLEGVGISKKAKDHFGQMNNKKTDKILPNKKLSS